MSCTFAEPSNKHDRTGTLMPCVVYAHGNSGNKLEGLVYAEKVLPLGINFCAFDFSGCGNSEGRWVTLGYKERN